MTNFVYPYIIPKNPVFGWELMYSIRSIYKNFEGEFSITLIGEIPDWINREEINCIEFNNNYYGKRVASRTNQKLLLAADAFSDFVWMNDDIILINKCSKEEVQIPRYIGDRLRYTKDEKGLNTFKKLMRYTWFELQKLNKPNNFNYSSHIPIWYQSDKIKELSKKFNLTSSGDYTCLTTLAYFNYFEIEGIPVKDYRVGFWGETDTTINKETKILNFDDKGFFANPWIVSYLQKLFSKKCKGEKN